ncbi:HepT-like ribonuclease domain-containing protein [Humibacter sp.]|uniref:HepT-like ribonuclease domain-containing protein n=1 Tax=Humibacter sp. TaxID=1940291 RepID=UPI003F7E525C
MESYLDGGPVTWATERQLELIGESLGKLRRADPDLADRIPNLHQIIAMRNVLIHGYLVVNSRVVWLAATRSVPELIPVLENLLREIDNDPAGSPP